MATLQDVSKAVIEGDIERVVSYTKDLLDAGTGPLRDY